MKSKIAFSFVVEELDPLLPVVAPMFGCHSVYIGEKIVLILRNVAKEPQLNGVWVAVTPEGYESLSKEFAATMPFGKPKPGKAPWILLASGAPDFEAKAMKACELILSGDARIGRVTKQAKLKLESEK